MKRLKKLSREHKQFLSSKGFSTRNFLVERSTPKEYRFFNKETNKIEIFKKEGGTR